MIETNEIDAARQERETGFASLVEHYETLLWGTTHPDGLARRLALSVLHGRALKEDAERRIDMRHAALAMAHATNAARQMLQSETVVQLIIQAHAQSGTAVAVMGEVERMLRALEKSYLRLAGR